MPTLRVFIRFQIPIGFDDDALQRTFSVNTALGRAVIVLPQIEWQDDHPWLSSPQPGRDMLERIGKDTLFPNALWPWGSASSWKKDTREVNVNVLGAIASIEIAPDVDPASYLRDGKMYRDGAVAEVRVQLAQWRSDFVEWVSLIAGQHVSPRTPDIPSIAEEQAEGTIVWLEDPDPVPHVSYQGGNITLTINNDESSGFVLDTSTLNNVESLMASGATPSTQLRLLRSARVAIRRDERRLALIELGSAAELCLWNLYDHPVVRSTDKDRATWTLGTLLNKVFLASDPTGKLLDSLVVKPRNDAIHRAVECDRATAMKAFALVRRLVSDELPFPIVGTDNDAP